MIIFRFSAAFLAVCVTGCIGSSDSGDGRPPADSELGRIVRIPKFDDAAAALQKFAEERAGNRVALRNEFAKAGFKRSAYVDGPDNSQCEQFELKTKENWPSVYAVDICEGKVFASAGQQAP